MQMRRTEVRFLGLAMTSGLRQSRRRQFMSFFRQYRTGLLFAFLLILCSVMVVRQFNRNRSRHVELRDAFVMLEVKGYRPQAEKLFQRLLNELPRLSSEALLDDFQRTLTLVDPSKQQPENLIWKYHWTVSNELERRSERALDRALRMAGEE
jgi:hypothetical protein